MKTVASKIALLLREIRAPFLPASAAPVILGSVLAYSHTGDLNWPVFLLALLGVQLIHAGANVANDYFDHLSGNDAVNRTFVRPFTGGSRMIQKGLLSPGEVLTLSISCIVLGVFASVLLALAVGWEVLALGAAGIIGGFFYIAPPVRFGHRGMGEIIVAIDFGILPVAGAYFVQTGEWSVESLMLSVPVAVLIAGVLFINEFQDRDADAAVGKRTWVVRIGLRQAAKFHALLMILWPAPVIIAALKGILHPATLVCVIALVTSIPAAVIVMRRYEEPDKLVTANLLTIITHLGAALLLSAGLAFGT